MGADGRDSYFGLFSGAPLYRSASFRFNFCTTSKMYWADVIPATSANRKLIDWRPRRIARPPPSTIPPAPAGTSNTGEPLLPGTRFAATSHSLRGCVGPPSAQAVSIDSSGMLEMYPNLKMG